jgi:metal-responsive CopG/Arc/MetJ family transcriptional regulator
MVMARTQTLVQLSDSLVAALDQRAAQQRRSRSDLIREALERYLAEDLEAEIDRQIVEAYRRIPQTAEDEAWARASGRDMIREEPW